MNSDQRGHCPHCGAIAHQSICTICGKSAFEEVVAPPPRVRRKWWQTIDPRTARRQALVLSGIVAFAAVTTYLLTREDPPPDPAALPAPDETSLTTSTTSPPGEAPSIDRGDRGPTPTLPDLGGVDRDVGGGLSPWEEAPPVHFVTGNLLPERDDYTVDIARVQEILAAFPAAFSLDPLEDPELLTFGGPIDLAVTEATQPFAARTMASRTGAIGELWLIASGGSSDGDTYLAAARARWDTDIAVEQFAPTPGVRLWKLGEDATNQMWVTELTADSLALVQVPVGVPPTSLAAAIEAWRANLST